MSEAIVTIGELRITPVVTSRFRLDGGSMFGVVPRALWQQGSPPDELNRIELSVNCLVVRTPTRTVVIEPGMGQKYDDRSKQIYALDELDAAAALAGAGVDPSSVDIVIPTHLHLDHAGGSTALSPSGSVESAFPNATVVVQEAEWEAATFPGPLEKRSYNPDDYLPLERSGQLRIVSGDVEVTEGVSVELTGGHTRGHQVVRIESAGQEALFLGDIVPTTAHLRLSWLMAWDLEPLVVFEAKERLLRDAASRGVMCFFPHDPRMAGCKLEPAGIGSYRAIEDTIIEAR